MSVSDITFWKPIISFIGQPSFASATFSPSLCTIVKTNNKHILDCKVVNSGLYDGEYKCVIDKYESCSPFGLSQKSVFYVATLPVQWKGNPDSSGFIIIK